MEPFDEMEARHIEDAVAWIESGAEIFRIGKPATPPKHLVVYAALIDPERNKILLGEHVNAGLWLPPGGHVERGEHPKTTAERETWEELGMSADFIMEEPFFLTQALTVGKAAGHTDVDLWYALKGDARKTIDFDPREFMGFSWLSPQEIFDTDISQFDPHMHRFVKKLIVRNLLSS